MTLLVPGVRGMQGRRWFATLLGVMVSVVAQAQAPVVELHVEGNSRLPSAGVIAASGLKVGTTVTRKELDAAAQKLFETGFFRSVNYRYQPKPAASGTGYAVTLQVSEEKADRPVQLDIPGVDEEELWMVLKSADVLIDKTMPDSEPCAAYYQRAIEAALDRSNRRKEITMNTEADLATGKMIAIFRPANLPSASEIRFDGNQQIGTSVLTAAVSGLLLGKEYSERFLRRVLDSNVKPLYEEKALLTVTFPAVKVVNTGEGMVSVTVTIDEGRAWTLGKVDISGDELPLDEMRKAAAFPEGKPANWKQVTAEIAAMELVLRRNGYLGVSSSPERLYRKDTGIVDVAIRVKKGKQFLFGSLQLSGLSPGVQRESMAIWKLREGVPLNGPYIDDYLRSVLRGPASDAHGVQQQLNVRPGTNVIDVAIAFK